ncbi:MAG: hypothetical protein QM731_24930 [Chitinophagaceae bacterium]
MQVKVTSTLLLLCMIYAHASAQVVNAVSPEKEIDSLPAKVNRQVKENIKEKKQQLLSSADTLWKGTLRPAETEFRKLLGDIKSPATGLFDKVKLFDKGKFVSAGNVKADVSYTYLRDTSGQALGIYRNMEGSLNYNAAIQVSLASMPFDFAFSGTNGIYTGNYPSFDKLTKFNFDHKQYLENIKKKVMDKIDPNVVVAYTMSRINAIKDSYEQQLKGELQQINEEFSKQYHSSLSFPAGVTDLSKTDLATLKGTLLSQVGADKYQQSALRLQEALKNGDVADLGKDSLLTADMATVKKMEVLEKAYQKIVGWKDKFENNKLVKELKSHLPFTPGNYKSFLDNPGNLQKIVGEYANLGPLQRLFMNMNQLKLGQNAVNNNDFDLKNVINSGIQAEFKNKTATVGFLYGKNQNPNNWLQGGLSSAVTNEYSNVTGFKVGTGSGSPIEQSISVNLFEFKNFDLTGHDPALQADYFSMPLRRDATISLHSAANFSSKHKLSVDVSKSIGSYVNNMTSDSNGYKTNAYRNVLNNKGQSNYAAMVEYDGELLNTAVSVTFKTVGLGYNNPGNTLLRSGETQVGIGLGKSLLKKQLQIRYNIDYRRQVFDPLKIYKYISWNNKVQLGYKISRGYRVGLTYQRSDFQSKLFADGNSSGVNERLQVDGSYVYRIAGKKVNSNASISRQHLVVPSLVGQNYTSNSLMLMHSAVTVLHKNPLSLLVLMNVSDNKDYLFNTSMFTAETGYSYALTTNVRLSNSIGYYSNSGWNKQVGIRQQVSTTLFQKLSMDVDVSYKKAVEMIRPELANQLFITAGMHYSF